jgi:hypothetical protein
VVLVSLGNPGAARQDFFLRRGEESKPGSTPATSAGQPQTTLIGSEPDEHSSGWQLAASGEGHAAISF